MSAGAIKIIVVGLAAEGAVGTRRVGGRPQSTTC